MAIKAEMNMDLVSPKFQKITLKLYLQVAQQIKLHRRITTSATMLILMAIIICYS